MYICMRLRSLYLRKTRLPVAYIAYSYPCCHGAPKVASICSMWYNNNNKNYKVNIKT